ncbi:hypothetical protein ACHOLT_08760 [Desulfitobacterium sp. Sab5]|uniref:hypothetical protein n=1 Tax=Desulfitobacterium nosdiversum TaxID=3375356 RepID=UPI003CE74B38
MVGTVDNNINSLLVLVHVILAEEFGVRLRKINSLDGIRSVVCIPLRNITFVST